MGSRTMIRQQIMRQMVMEEEKPRKETHNVLNNSYNMSSKGSYHSISQNSGTLPSLTSTMVGADKHYAYCKPVTNDLNSLNFHLDSNNCNGDDYVLLSNDFNEPLNLLPNMYPMENNKYSVHSYNTDYSLQSSNIDNNIDSISYNNQYHNSNNKLNHMGQMPEVHPYETSFSCPVTGDQMTTTSSVNQRRMSNSNSAVIGAVLLNYDDKRVQMKDRSKKESHNRIERKRRDFINQQIVELSNLLPVQMMTEGESKKNKGNILKNSVFYIQFLQNEMNNTLNYVKETDLAFSLIDGYRKQVQELQQQIKSSTSPDISLSPTHLTRTDSYNEYITLRDKNRRSYQSNNQLLLSSNHNLSTEMLNRYGPPSSSYVKSPRSPFENGAAFKIEPSSVHSSTGNNSVSNRYRIDEESDIGFHASHDMMPPNVISNQHMTPHYASAPSAHDESLFNSNNHYPGIGRHTFESMEC